jgi:hypothetical protein
MGKAEYRTARNVTLSISEEGYRNARIWAARHGFSMSAGLAFLIENLDDMSRIARQLRSENPELPQKLEERRNGKLKTKAVKL